MHDAQLPFQITHATSADICMHREKAKIGSLVSMKTLLYIAAPSDVHACTSKHEAFVTKSSHSPREAVLAIQSNDNSFAAAE
jgi:hypothetical protein